jgi:hypothetical protein
MAVLAAWPAWAQTATTEVVGEEAFNLPRLAKIARTHLPVKRGEWMRLTLFATEPSPFFLQQSSAESWAAWYKAWRSAASIRWRVAEMIAIGDDAVLRIRAGRATSRVVVGGRDPLLIEVSGRRYEILHISGAKRTTVYMRGPQPFPCDDLHRILRGRIDSPVIVKVRSDPWFVADPGFPAFYWFQSLAPPSKEGVESAPQSTCGG